MPHPVDRALLQHTQRRARALAPRYAMDFGDAEDVAMETLAVAAIEWDGRGLFTGYLEQRLRWRLYDALRSRRHRHASSNQFYPEQVPLPEYNDPPADDDVAERGIARVYAAQVVSQVLAAAAALGPVHHAVMVEIAGGAGLVAAGAAAGVSESRACQVRGEVLARWRYWHGSHREGRARRTLPA